MPRKPGILVLAAAFLVVFALSGCGSARAPELPQEPTYRIQGSMTFGDGEPLTTASIVLERSPLGAMTDTRGNFDLGPLRPGSYEVRVLYMGFQSNPGDMPIPGPGEGTDTFPMYPIPGREAQADSVLPVTVTYRVVEAN